MVYVHSLLRVNSFLKQWLELISISYVVMYYYTCCTIVYSIVYCVYTIIISNYMCSQLAQVMADHGASSELRSSKLRRLDSFRRSLPHVSASSLSAILSAIATQGLPDRHSRWDLGQARSEAVQELTPYGPILQTLTLSAKTGAICLLMSPASSYVRIYGDTLCI